jgi:hypothetical protein
MISVTWLKKVPQKQSKLSKMSLNGCDRMSVLRSVCITARLPAGESWFIHYRGNATLNREEDR